MIKMPWANHTAPNVMLEVTDACNLSCRACYKRAGNSFKSLEQIQAELDAAAKLRPLHTVTISGGEPTLHPELRRIIALIKQRQYHVFLLTNGVLVEPGVLHALRTAGLDSILFHIDLGQQRPDLPANPDFTAVKQRLTELVIQAAACGLDASVSATLYDNDLDYLRQFSTFIFDMPEISMAFISSGTHPETHQPVSRSPAIAASAPTPPALTATEIQVFYLTEFGVEPYGYIPSVPSGRISWLSFFVPVAYHGQERRLYRIRSNWSDLWLMQLAKLICGHYIHKTSQAPLLTLLRLAVNALTHFRPFALAHFLLFLAVPKARLRHKMMVYDVGPVTTADGSTDHCEYCPTAILRGQVLLPCCVADYGTSSTRCHS